MMPSKFEYIAASLTTMIKSEDDLIDFLTEFDRQAGIPDLWAITGRFFSPARETHAARERGAGTAGGKGAAIPALQEEDRQSEYGKHILALYSRGMDIDDIVKTLQGIFGTRICADLVKSVTDRTFDEFRAMQSRRLAECYPLIFFKVIPVKIYQDKRSVEKNISLVVGVNEKGQKDILGVWPAERIDIFFWFSILAELHRRGIEEMDHVVEGGFPGFREVIKYFYPLATIQLCPLQLLQNSLKQVSFTDCQAVARDLKRVFQAENPRQAKTRIDEFAAGWNSRYPSVSGFWQRHWPTMLGLLAFPDEVRRTIVNIEALESLETMIREAINRRRIFHDEKSALKVVFLAGRQAVRKWRIPRPMITLEWHYQPHRAKVQQVREAMEALPRAG